MNTEISYMYRDASNYKQTSRIVLAGEISTDERAALAAHLDSACFGDRGFIPEQVGMENLRERFETHFPDDGVWHEIDPEQDIQLVPTSVRPMGWEDGEDVHEFVKAFVATQWQERVANRRLREWKRSTPRGH